MRHQRRTIPTAGAHRRRRRRWPLRPSTVASTLVAAVLIAVAVGAQSHSRPAPWSPVSAAAPTLSRTSTSLPAPASTRLAPAKPTPTKSTSTKPTSTKPGSRTAARPSSHQRPVHPPPPRPAARSTAATATPTTIGSPSSASLTQQVVQDLFGRLNAERRARGLAPLAWDARLAGLAVDWSRRMGQDGNLHHRDLQAVLAQPAFARFSALGENIAYVQGFPNEAYELHVGWMRSSGHRANMLQPGFDTVGIGLACVDGVMWATQDFGRAKDSSGPPLASGIPPESPIVATAKDGLSCR